MKSRSLVIGVAAIAVVCLVVWAVTAFRPAAPPSTVVRPTQTAAAPPAQDSRAGGGASPAPAGSAPRALPPPAPSAQTRRAPDPPGYVVQSAEDDESTANVFPWPPPAPSTSYQLPNSYFATAATMGAVAESITHALESSGYVERRYYKLPVDGLALVTRLERVNTDGSPAAPRWLTSDAGRTNLYLLIRGLFVTDPGHYRVIVFFITKDLPGRKLEDVPIAQAKAWLKGGLDDVPAAAAALPYANGRTIAYIYDFVSNGRTFVLDREPLPGKDQLTKAGVLTALGGGGK